MHAGIDYGLGRTNLNKETGIRFGVIHSNQIDAEAASDFYSKGDDLDFEKHKRDLKESLAAAIEKVLDEYNHERSNDSENLAEEIVDHLDYDGYEGTGECQRTWYERDGYKISSNSRGELFVQESPFFTYAPFCSPCAPGACSIDEGCEDDSLPKAYCLNADWFGEDEFVCPYPVFEVGTGKQVYAVPIIGDAE